MNEPKTDKFEILITEKTPKPLVILSINGQEYLKATVKITKEMMLDWITREILQSCRDDINEQQESREAKAKAGW